MSETTRRAPVGRLRAWQAAALERYMAASPRDFLAVATPGAGKTTFALTLATELIARGVVDKLTVVCPTEHLKGQWASSAARFGIHIDPDLHEPPTGGGRIALRRRGRRLLRDLNYIVRKEVYDIRDAKQKD